MLTNGSVLSRNAAILMGRCRTAERGFDGEKPVDPLLVGVCGAHHGLDTPPPQPDVCVCVFQRATLTAATFPAQGSRSGSCDTGVRFECPLVVMGTFTLCTRLFLKRGKTRARDGHDRVPRHRSRSRSQRPLWMCVPHERGQPVLSFFYIYSFLFGSKTRCQQKVCPGEKTECNIRARHACKSGGPR